LPKGVIHIGIQENKELNSYIDMGVQKIICIEVDSDIYNKIKHISNNNPNIIIANCSISNKNSQTDKIVTRTLDQFFVDIKQRPEDFNILNIDLNSLKLLALSDTNNFLKHIAIIVLKLNSEELHKDFTSTDILANFLKEKFFNKIDYKSLNDAVYISDNIIQISTLGINGRFANQIFQHMFASVYAFENNLKTEFPTWIGQQLFDINDNPITRTLEQIQLDNNLPKESLTNKDVIGWFQYHTSYYKKYFDIIKKTYQFKSEIKEIFNKKINNIIKNKTLIVIHIRMSDYGTSNTFFVTPIKYYIDWLDDILRSIDNYILYIASDDQGIHKQFTKYNIITSKDINVLSTQATYLNDFYMITQANYLAISNSSFSFLGSMLNDKFHNYDTSCVRPSLKYDKLINYDPWNSDVLLREEPLKNQTLNEVKPIRKLHIGGQQAHPDWEILNLENTPITDHVGDAKNLFKFDDNTFDEIYASHILEHFDYQDLHFILEEWRRVLKISGTISISVPDVENIASIMVRMKHDAQGQTDLMRMIFGGHIDNNDYHYSGFTRKILITLLQNTGFKDIKIVRLLNNIFTDTSSMKYNGALISLNAIAVK
jgi:predicted SAM-dependent methyltransferase